MTSDIIDFVNKSSRDEGIANRLFGAKKFFGSYHFRIMEKDEDQFYLPIYELCPIHEKLIKKALQMGMTFDDE